MRLLDTDLDVRRRQLACYRGLAPERRIQLSVELSELARATALAGIVERHPELDDDGITARLLETMYGTLGREAAKAVLGR